MPSNGDSVRDFRSLTPGNPMQRAVTVVTLLTILVVLAGCSQTPQSESPTVSTPTVTTSRPTVTETPPVTEPTAPTETPTVGTNATLGEEDGIGYSASLGWVNATDGLNDTELEAVVSRSIARVEHLREREFDFRVPVTVISRQTFTEEYTNETISPTVRTFDNGKFEALFLVGESEDSVEVQRRNFRAAVLGFYDAETDRIVIVSNRDSVSLAEPVLGHELVHALQYQRFNASRFDRASLDRSNAISSLLEGDARHLDRRYSQQCRTNWSCIRPEASFGSQSGGGGIPHFGLYYLRYFPYSDGPVFIDHFYERGGWDRVDRLYREPPESAEQVIAPSKYRNDSPSDAFVLDRSTEKWVRVRPADRPPAGTVGQAGIAAMFAYPTFHSRSGLVVSSTVLLNRDNDRLQSVDPFEYGFDYVDGWDGDTLWIHRNRSGELGYVWRIVWDSSTDAREFASGYRILLDHWGAEPVEGRANTWRIPENESAFADAFAVNVDRNRVTIVNAPTVPQVEEVHAPAGDW